MLWVAAWIAILQAARSAPLDPALSAGPSANGSLTNATTQLGDPFIQRAKPDIQLDMDTRSPTKSYPAAQVAHMWVSDVSSAWEKENEHFGGKVEFTDVLVPGSRTAFVLLPGVIVSSQLFGWIFMEALNIYTHARPPGQSTYMVPTWWVFVDGKILGQALTSITNPPSAGNIPSGLSANQSAIFQRSGSFGAPNSGNGVNKLLGVREEVPDIDVSIRTLGTQLGMTKVLGLFLEAFKKWVWNLHNLRPVEDLWKAGEGFIIGSPNEPRLCVVLDKVRQGTWTIDIGYIEVVLKQLILFDEVKNGPVAFEAQGWIKDSIGRRPSTPYITVTLVGPNSALPAARWINSGTSATNASSIEDTTSSFNLVA